MQHLVRVTDKLIFESSNPSGGPVENLCGNSVSLGVAPVEPHPSKHILVVKEALLVLGDEKLSVSDWVAIVHSIPVSEEEDIEGGAHCILLGIGEIRGLCFSFDLKGHSLSRPDRKIVNHDVLQLDILGQSVFSVGVDKGTGRGI